MFKSCFPLYKTIHEISNQKSFKEELDFFCKKIAKKTDPNKSSYYKIQPNFGISIHEILTQCCRAFINQTTPSNSSLLGEAIITLNEIPHSSLSFKENITDFNQTLFKNNRSQTSLSEPPSKLWIYIAVTISLSLMMFLLGVLLGTFFKKHSSKNASSIAPLRKQDNLNKEDNRKNNSKNPLITRSAPTILEPSIFQR